MNLSLQAHELLDYTSRQLDHLFPDPRPVRLRGHRASFDTAIDRLENCFRPVRSPRYSDNGITCFNHLYSDHYIVYLWFLANTLWKDGADDNLLNKLYYLNKSLHGFDCMFNTALPERFLIIHGCGTVLGKAVYGDCFVAHQGCTVGVHDGKYPVIGKGVAMAANSAVIGGSTLGDFVSVGSTSIVFNSAIPAENSVYRSQDGKITVAPSRKFFSDFYFDLGSV